jgi:hypothetical protein
MSVGVPIRLQRLSNGGIMCGAVCSNSSFRITIWYAEWPWMRGVNKRTGWAYNRACIAELVPLQPCLLAGPPLSASTDSGVFCSAALAQCGS